MNIYVGNEFFDAWCYVPLLLIAASFSAISTFYGAMFGALKKSVACMWSTVIGAIINLLVNYVFIKFIGTWGALIGTVSALLVMAMVRMLWANHYIQMKIYWRYLVIDIIILFTEGILVSLNWNIVCISLISIILFMLNHFDIIKSFFSLSKQINNV